jgi:hypothetical protein
MDTDFAEHQNRDEEINNTGFDKVENNNQVLKKSRTQLEIS